MKSDSIEQSVESSLLIVTFAIGEARFGIDAGRVQEVVQQRAIARVHHAPRFVAGVMNLRGRVITVIDLGEKLELGPASRSEDTRILIIEWKQEFVGLLVDNVEEVVSVERESISKQPGNVHGIQSTLIAGVFQDVRTRLAALLDVDAIVDIEEKDLAQR